MTRKYKEEYEMGNVIMLNKPFLGGWLNNDGNIGHEIIDFLLTDNGEYYVYNNPWGICPEDIWVEGTTELTRGKKEKYVARYLLLTGSQHKKDFEILYVIELGEKLHRHTTAKAEKNKSAFRDRQEKVKELIRKRNIKYNGKYLDEIYKNDDSLYLTFQGKMIYKALSPIPVIGLTYNFQRNKGYIFDDEYPSDYSNIIALIEDSIQNGSLQEFTPRSVTAEQIGQLNSNRTFLDLIGATDNEQVYTNMLHSVLEQGTLIKHFCEKYKGEKAFDSAGTFKVFRETKVVDGRMDVCAESENQRVIIENKVYSGLNGIKPADQTTQLSTYYKNWGKEKKMEPLCFIAVPDFKVDEIKREIAEYDRSMETIYCIISYGKIADFLVEELNAGSIPQTYAYYNLMPQIINAFRNLSYSTKEDLYARMFLSATNG